MSVTDISAAKSIDIPALHNECNISFVTLCCPTCGSPIAVDDIAKVLAPHPRKIYESVKAAGAAGIHRRRIEALLYGHRADGGPTTDCIKVAICRSINPLLKPLGLHIKARARIYRMEHLSHD